jgi:hypothetical protein
MTRVTVILMFAVWSLHAVGLPCRASRLATVITIIAVSAIGSGIIITGASVAARTRIGMCGVAVGRAVLGITGARGRITVTWVGFIVAVPSAVGVRWIIALTTV